MCIHTVCSFGLSAFDAVVGVRARMQRGHGLAMSSQCALSTLELDHAASLLGWVVGASGCGGPGGTLRAHDYAPLRRALVELVYGAALERQSEVRCSRTSGFPPGDRSSRPAPVPRTLPCPEPTRSMVPLYSSRSVFGSQSLLSIPRWALCYGIVCCSLVCCFLFPAGF